MARDDGTRDRPTRGTMLQERGRNAPVLDLTLVDRAIAWVSPRRGLARARARSMFQTLARSYDAAATGRRTEGWRATGSSANAEIGPALSRLRARSRELVRNNAYAASAVEKLTANIVGPGIVVDTRTSDKGRNKLADDLWNEWTQECDADGDLDWNGLEELACRTIVESGGLIVRYLPRRSEEGLVVPLQVQLLEPDHLDTAKNGRTTDGGLVLQGIQYDANGRRVAYWLFPTHPGERLAIGNVRNKSVPVPADQIVYPFRKLRPAQQLGVPWLASVMLRLRDIDDFADAELMRKKVAACFAAFVTRPAGAEGPSVGVASSTSDGERTDSIEPGLINYMQSGEELEFSNPPTSGGYAEYMRTELRAAAAGIGVTYEQLTNDLSGISFASYKAGHLEFRRSATMHQKNVMIAQFCAPIRRQFTRFAIFNGALPPGLYPSTWTPPAFGSVEPLKDALADTALVRGGFASLQQKIRERGGDPLRLLEDLIEFAGLVDDAELVLDTDPRKVGKAGIFQSGVDVGLNEGGGTPPTEEDEP